MGIEYEDSMFEALGPDNVDMDSIRNSHQCKKKCEIMTNGELGCELSHVAILRDFLSKEFRYCMVFEDDARVNPAVIDFFAKGGYKTVKETLTMLADTHNEWEWNQLNLGACGGRCFDRKYLNVSLPERVKMAAETHSYCAMAYLVTREGAQLILEEVKYKGLQVADHGIRREKLFKQVSLEPRLFDQTGGQFPAIHQRNGLKTPQYMGYCMDKDLREKIGHR
uniref:Glycosyl transferase family 25 domain-containing protein n=1 Tax=Amorphochlora amoebiformis TaxID=1561963 RepID=A0A7S0DJW9_9EUKA|mmetsp:Transcript_31343/g.50347  ORF Transcript_31343/g.50347 Transcript_31343/m.50347 type:complete len:223 (+) Transcript_31343:2-670(+)